MTTKEELEKEGPSCNPEDETITVNEEDVQAQLGSMTIQLLRADKMITHLQKIIKDLRNAS